MYVLPDKPTVYFDVDDTLISYDTDRIEANFEDCLRFEDASGPFYVAANWLIVDKLMSHAKAGQAVIVWSQQGADWCREVCEALEIEAFVTACIGKPSWFYDDLPVSTFMNNGNWYSVRLGPSPTGKKAG